MSSRHEFFKLLTRLMSNLNIYCLSLRFFNQFVFLLLKKRNIVFLYVFVAKPCISALRFFEYYRAQIMCRWISFFMLSSLFLNFRSLNSVNSIRSKRYPFPAFSIVCEEFYVAKRKIYNFQKFSSSNRSAITLCQKSFTVDCIYVLFL